MRWISAALSGALILALAWGGGMMLWRSEGFEPSAGGASPEPYQSRLCLKPLGHKTPQPLQDSPS